MALNLLWLGHPQVEQDGQPVRFETRKATALLAYLSLEPREHAREALASIFWPNYDQEHALGNLRRALSSLNKSLGSGWMKSTREALRLYPTQAWCLDVHTFQQRLVVARAHRHAPSDTCAVCCETLEEAVALYRGDFLEGFTLRDCPAFDDWQLFRRESLKRELGLALEMLAERRAAAGSWQAAIDCARRWLNLDPLHEPAQRLLMALYSRSGDRNAALRQYETCRATLLAELGQAPEAATTALYEEIVIADASPLSFAAETPPVTVSQHRAMSPRRHEEESRRLALRPAPFKFGETGPLAYSETPMAGPLIHTKLRPPFSRPQLVARPRLQEQIAHGLLGPLTLITAPAGFGKTTLVASCIASCGLPVAWLSLDKDDNQSGRFLSYLIAALRKVDQSIGNEAEQIMATSQQAPPMAVLSHLVNDLDSAGGEIVLVLDDYQFISSQTVHDEVAFLLEHCPTTLHVVIATRSDPPLPLARLRARGHTVELRATDLRFTEAEAAQFLNGVMGLRLDSNSVAALAERTEGWVAGLQMAALSVRDREDVHGFVEGFSGTNRYILDYLLEEVLGSQPPEIQRFLLHTSILERLTAPLCDAVLADDKVISSQSAAILDYLVKANIFLVPLDDERVWFRYHHLFADLLRAQLQSSLGTRGVAQLHIRAAEWHGENGSVLEAIHHAAMASDDERVERFIEQNYRELVSRGEQSWMRFWTGNLSKELVYRRPWLCIYEALSHSWFGELDKADQLLEEAEKRIQSEILAPHAHAMQGFLAYVRSRVTAMRGDIHQAIEYCIAASEYVAASNLAQQLDTRSGGARAAESSQSQSSVGPCSRRGQA